MNQTIAHARKGVASDDERATKVAASSASVGAPCPPQRDRADQEEHDPCDDREQAGEVVTGGAAVEEVVDRRHAHGDGERAEGHRRDRPQAGAQARVYRRDRPPVRRWESARSRGGRPAEVPGSGWRKLSSTMWRPTTPTAIRSQRGLSADGARTPSEPACLRSLSRGDGAHDRLAATLVASARTANRLRRPAGRSVVYAQIVLTIPQHKATTPLSRRT